ncbi:MAG: hypothetical protein SGBAC_008999 [Bacillariaceae sp.]
MELSHAYKKESDVPSLISLVTLREGCFEMPSILKDASKSEVSTNDALLAILDGTDFLEMSSSSQHSLLQDSDSTSRRTIGRLNSMIPIRKPERQPSWESLNGDEPSITFHESPSAKNAVFDVITSENNVTNRGSDLLRRSMSTPKDIALCKPKRKSSSENLTELPKLRQARHSLDSLILTRW